MTLEESLRNLFHKAEEAVYIAVERVLDAAEAFHPLDDEEPFFTDDFVMPGDPHVPFGDVQWDSSDHLDDGLGFLREQFPDVEVRHFDPDNEDDLADLWRELFEIPSPEEVIATQLRNCIEEAQAYGEPVDGDDIFAIVVDAFKLGYQTSEYELTGLNDEWFNEFRPF